MVRISSVSIEKTTVNIPSCIVDKPLIKELGEVLEKETVLEGHLHYFLDSEKRDVRRHKYKNFIATDWGKSALNRITISTFPQSFYPKLKIEFNFHYAHPNRFSVAGTDSTWVNGIASQIENVFNTHRTSYSPIRDRKVLKLFVIFALAAILCLPIILLVVRFLNELYLINQVAVSLMPFCLISIGVFFLIDWLFPHLEYEGMKQKRIRKYIWVTLFSTGIVPTLVLHFLFGI